MATVAHCYYCFDVLASRLEGRPALPLAKLESLVHQQEQVRKLSKTNGTNGTALTNGYKEAETNGYSSYAVAASALPKMPLFVTWKKLSSSGHLDLRGCIGTFEAKALESGLKDYALTALIPLLEVPELTG
jgi:hypothetical protein